MKTACAIILATLLATSTGVSAQQAPAKPQSPPPRQPAAAASGTSPRERIHVELDGIYHAATQTMSDSASPTLYAETGQLTASYEVPAGPGFSGSVSMRVWKNLAIGVGGSSFTASFPATVTGSIPNPFQFNRHRTFEGRVDGLERKEIAVGVYLRGLFRLSPRLTAGVFAGPARLSITQDVVTAIRYSESYPYDTATFSAAAISTDKQHKWGVSAGADLVFYLTRNIGIGIGAKYNGGEAELTSLGAQPLTSTLGGAEFGGGLRLRF